MILRYESTNDRPALPVRLESFQDVRRLPVDVAAEDLVRLYMGDEESFTLLVVAEASQSGIPNAVAALLRSPEYVAPWVDALISMEGTHQLAWWDKYLKSGPFAPETMRAGRTLEAIRLRLREARAIERKVQAPHRGGRMAKIAKYVLETNHHAEAEAMSQTLLAATGAFAGQTPRVRQLLAMRDLQFRDLVAEDVQAHPRVPELLHPAVLERWWDALVGLAEIAIESIGAEITEDSARLRFPVDDAVLLNVSAEDRSHVIRKLTFLRHVRVRMADQKRARRKLGVLLKAKVEDPVHDRLAAKYADEYRRLCEAPAIRLPDPPPGASQRFEPGAFAALRTLLKQSGWATATYMTGRRAWLDARHPARGRIVITTKTYAASNLGFLIQGESGWPWFRLADEPAFNAVLTEGDAEALQGALEGAQLLGGYDRDYLIDPLDDAQ